MDVTIRESVRESAKRGAAFAFLLGPDTAPHWRPIVAHGDLPAGDHQALARLFGMVSPVMVAAYRGAFEAVANHNRD